MVLDLALVVFVLLALALGHFLGVWRHLGVVAALAVGYALTPLWVAPAMPRVSALTGWPPVLGAVACVAAGMLVPALLTAWALRNVGVTGSRAESESSLTLVLEAFAGSLAWGAAALLGGLGLLGAFALQEPDALVTSDRISVPLRSSRAYEEVARFGLLRPPGMSAAQELGAAPRISQGAPAKPQVKIDEKAMKKDPRLRAALADPVVRRAMETGDTSELERRNRLLRPLGHDPATPPKGEPGVPSFIDPRDLR